VEGDDIQKVISDKKAGEQSDDEATADAGTDDADTSAAAELGLKDGEHSVAVTLTGGTGRASVDSPAVIRVSGDKCTAVIRWSSPHYDYMIVDGERYEPVNTEGNSVFEIPVPYFDKPFDIIADTTAMSEAHKIEYTLTFDSASVE
jgi:hypothetical protein